MQFNDKQQLTLQCCCSCAQILPARIIRDTLQGTHMGSRRTRNTIAQILPPATAQLLSSPVFRCIEDTDRQYMCGELATSLRLSWWNLTLLYSICKNRRIGLQTCQWLCLNCVISDCGSYRAILSYICSGLPRKSTLWQLSNCVGLNAFVHSQLVTLNTVLFKAVAWISHKRRSQTQHLGKTVLSFLRSTKQSTALAKKAMHADAELHFSLS